MWKTHRAFIATAVVFLCAAYSACTNPFAPARNDSIGNANTPLGDQRTVDGFFQKFSYAYAYKDTTIYGQLLCDTFTFAFRDYSQNADVSWGRDEEMHTTYGLFQNTQNLSLIWNQIILQTGDSLNQQITRAFDLTITFNPEDVEFISGNADLTLIRAHPDSAWTLTYWHDNSNY